MINRGRLLYDGALDVLVARIARTKRMSWCSEETAATAITSPRGAGRVREVKSFHFPKCGARGPAQDAPATSARLLAAFPVADLSIEDPPIEEVIRLAFRARHGGGAVIKRYAALIRNAWLVDLQYRASIVLWLLWGVTSRRSRSGIWWAIAGDGSVAGYARADFARLLLRRHAHQPADDRLDSWYLDRWIRDGELNYRLAGRCTRQRGRGGEHRVQGAHRERDPRGLAGRRRGVARGAPAARSRSVGAHVRGPCCSRPHAVLHQLHHGPAGVLDDARHGDHGVARGGVPVPRGPHRAAGVAAAAVAGVAGAPVVFVRCSPSRWTS